VTKFDAAAFEKAMLASLGFKGGGVVVVKEQRPSILNRTELYLVVEVLNNSRHCCTAIIMITRYELPCTGIR